MKGLEVGMYVRNDDFGIGKINKDYFDSKNKHWFNVHFNCYGDEDFHCGICEKSIGFKASHNIIDLIEEGDYVNGYKVDFVQNGYVVFNNNHPRQLLIYPNEIKSIVTKEKFESIGYKVVE